MQHAVFTRMHWLLFTVLYAETWTPLIGQHYINMALNKCMSKTLQQWCCSLRINGRRRSNRWIQGFSMCVTRTGKESESQTFPSCDWGSCAWWWAFNCPCHSSKAVLWPAHQRRQIFFLNGDGPSPLCWEGGDDVTLASHDVCVLRGVSGVTSRAGITASHVRLGPAPFPPAIPSDQVC